MPTPPPGKRSGRKKLPPERRYSERIVFRLPPPQYDRLARRAREHGMDPNDYARDRALGRVRPTRAQRRLATDGVEPLEEIGQFVEFAAALLPLLEPHFDAGSELGQLVRRARRRFSEPAAQVARLRSLIEEAVHP
ncbi:MAG TPA: hypothetical protein VNP72_09560 [Longimicrobium sp.]|nr:hypothetical protein [Longimicrobium sp.]